MDLEKLPETKLTRTLYSSEVEALLVKERAARQDSNAVLSHQMLTEIVKLVHEAGNIDSLCEVMILLATKRGQPVRAQVEMVKLCMGWIENIKDMDQKLKFIDTIKTVCDKKIYLEVEYARCCLMLVKFNETSENIDEAARILQDVQVETYGSMEYREKIEFILYQMKILIIKEDWIRLMIVSRKINTKYLEIEDLEDLTIVYYSYLFILHKQEKCYLDASRALKKIYDLIKANSKRVQEQTKKLDFDFNLDMVPIMNNSIYLSVLNTNCEEKTAL